MPSRFLNNITVNDEYTLPSTDGAADQIITTDGAGQLSFVDLNSIDGASSNFVYFDVKNETGSPILKGKGVMAVGTDGNSGHILIDEMVADGSVESKYFLGVLEEDIPNGGFARVISFGQLSQFDTRGQNGETWADGQVLWCDPANNGDFTITEPDGPNVKIAAAFILNSSTNGKIQVRVQANEGIHDLHDTKITSQVDGDVLVWKGTEGIWQNDSTLNVDYTNSRIGIGTTSPNHELVVQGTSSPNIELKNSNYSDGGFVLNRTNYNQQWKWWAQSSQMYFGFSTNESTYSNKMTIQSGGNVGIGTTSPAAKLEVEQSNSGTGTVFLSNSYNNKGFRTGNAGYATFSGYQDGNNTTSGNAYGALIGLNTFYNGTSFYNDNQYVDPSSILFKDGDIKFHTNDISATGNFTPNERLRITKNGNVGIGTTSPTTKLHVLGTTSSMPSLGAAPSAAQLGGLTYGTLFSTLTSGRGVIQQGRSDGTSLSFDLLLQPVGGNVGIGTSSAGAKLDVNGEIAIRGGEGSDDARMYFRASDQSNRFTIETDLDGNTNNDLLGFRSASTDNILVLKGNGNVGIGTTSPTEKLVVNGSINSQFQSGNFAAGNKRFFADGYADGNLARMGALSGASTDPMELAIYTSASGSSGGAERMRIDSSGNVGIGTTNPGYKLDVAGDLRVDNGNVGSTSGDEVEHVKIQGARHFLKFKEVRTANDSDWKNTTFKIQAGVDATNHQSIDFVVDGSYAEHIDIRTGNQLFNTRFTSSGNVGIGTTSPGNSLSIAGENPATTTLGNNFGQFGIFNGADQYGIQQWVTGSGDGHIQVGRIDGSATAYDLILQELGGNVGIGTTSPSEKLDVAGDARVQGRIYSNATALASVGILGKAIANGWAARYDSNNANYSGFYFDTNNHSIILGRVAGGTITNYIAASGSSYLNGGNVGIGVSSPSAKLQVSGTVKSKGLDVDGLANSSTNFLQYTRTDLTQPASISYDGTGGFDFNLNGGTVKFSDTNGGSIGIGTTSPASKLTIGGIGIGNTGGLKIEDPSNTAYGAHYSFDDASTTVEIGGVVNNALRDCISIARDATRTITIDTSERVGIGTTSPQEKLHVQYYTTGESHQAMFKGGAVTVGDYSYISLNNGYSTEYNKEVRLAAVSEQSNSNKTGFAVLTSPDSNGASGHERLRVTADGNVGIGATSPTSRFHVKQTLASPSVPMVYFEADRGPTAYGAVNVRVDNLDYGTGMRFYRSGTYDSSAIGFMNGSTSVGSISIGTSSTSYNTTSDYRLKENVASITDGITRLKQLQPKRFNFIGDTSVVDGFIAHEAKQVVPEAVTGEKDEVLPNGDPVYQGIDQAKLVPLLTAALQEAITKIEDLETRIQTLENN